VFFESLEIVGVICEVKWVASRLAILVVLDYCLFVGR
jgi:hypothetical protein